ncbi:hypothetical protein [Ectobacillus sp. sgz5001026]|uniref:hypothetical protein n=1 Tax=Ectobacillus sp. sgz5001026 TaxID=3242473 RepID=UPI0036D3AC67
MKIYSFFTFYVVVSILYGCFKGLFVFLKLYAPFVTLPAPLLESFGFVLYMLFSISVAFAYLKRIRYSIPVALFSLLWTSNIVWIWIYLHFLI